MVSATAPLARMIRVYVRAFDLRGGIRALSYKTGRYRFTLWQAVRIANSPDSKRPGMAQVLLNAGPACSTTEF
jgi:hypothetical protein